ncbi:hypothetical protein BCR34DRAFT_620834 [Clohesyomyces aquaticus]|uniref:MARVEL domain-containing protein n=1 Tax=Clohesyomyces aquaticus TaxID=1231657 RepID=A0A1Y2ABI0_9PLEO|nr:hypothetical protein BCR34DRAFT_620834 [Clohesyomyces aquaticus]
MGFSGLSFGFWRVMEIITLIPTLGMLAWFVHQYDVTNRLTPRSILVMFIVSVLAAAWAIGTLFLYSRAKHSAKFVAFVDLLFVGAFIGAVYELRGVSNADCTHFERSSYSGSLGDAITISGNVWRPRTNKTCAMLKASFAFGIMNCIFFFLTFIFALLVHRNYEGKREKVVVKRTTSHVSRHGHRSRSPRHSHHSSRRSHYV